ncbi:MAG TPA: hypothetical protein VMA77_09265 [Solirubrobacteraceae bacterium]|nr:hypothetical protein [Solirubrobacteraceae bacterium]
MDVDELYGLPLERFVPERNALAREQRNAGRRDEAAEVAALRKPSVAAWAVNQLVRTQRRGIGELLEAGDGLREAHAAVLEGRGDGSSLRAAVERERLAVEALIDAARGLLTSDGHELSPTIIDRVADTLQAAALDDDARRQVEDGRLERELRHVGLGVASGSPAPARAPTGAPTRARRTGGGASETPAKRAGAAGDTERALRERAQARAEARAEARAVEREARRRLERAERSAQLALERRDRAAQSLEEAEAELADAEDELGEAKTQVKDAERAVQDASD